MPFVLHEFFMRISWICVVMNEDKWKLDFTDDSKNPLKKMGNDYTKSSEIIKKYFF